MRKLGWLIGTFLCCFVLFFGSTVKSKLFLRSTIALVKDLQSDTILISRNPARVTPIASITKLMTAMVVLDSGLSFTDLIQILREDRDLINRSSSRLRNGMIFNRYDLLNMCLIASENRAALALARSFKGGIQAFVQQMNQKALKLGLFHTKFVDPTGLSEKNISTASDLVKLVEAVFKYKYIGQISTRIFFLCRPANRKGLMIFRNTNPLVKNYDWQVNLSKTGFIKEAGRCLVMHTVIHKRPMIVVLLKSWGRYSPLGDSKRIKKWLAKSIILTKDKTVSSNG